MRGILGLHLGGVTVDVRSEKKVCVLGGCMVCAQSLSRSVVSDSLPPHGL